MSVTIYAYGTIEARATINPDSTSQQSTTLMAEDTLTLNFTLPVPIKFHIGDYCYFFNKLYQVNVLPQVSKTAAMEFSYSLVMESEMYDLGRVQFLFLDAYNNFTESQFSFRGKPRDYGDLIVKNMLRVFPYANWKLGHVIDADFITQDFNGQNCLEALKTIASIFHTEYLIEDKIINLYQRNTSTGIIMQYGKDQPLLSLEKKNQTNANVITRLYAYGSTKNIVNSGSIHYRNGATHLKFSDGSYLEKNIDKYNVFESTIIFDGTTTGKNSAPLPEIYPHREGSIMKVDDFLNFYDYSMDFNVNDYLIPGVTAQIVFNSGLLAGYTFNIAAYNDFAKKFTINQNTDQQNLVVPTATITPMPGDSYVIINIRMPPQYIAKAEAALKSAAQAYLDDFATPPVQYSVACNSKYFQKNNVSFLLGQSVQIIDSDLDINTSSRITSFTRNVRNPYIYTMQLSDTVKPNTLIVQLINGL